jgi:hypothetical protein
MLETYRGPWFSINCMEVHPAVSSTRTHSSLSLQCALTAHVWRSIQTTLLDGVLTVRWPDMIRSIWSITSNMNGRHFHTAHIFRRVNSWYQKSAPSAVQNLTSTDISTPPLCFLYFSRHNRPPDSTQTVSMYRYKLSGSNKFRFLSIFTVHYVTLRSPAQRHSTNKKRGLFFFRVMFVWVNGQTYRLVGIVSFKVVFFCCMQLFQRPCYWR